MVPSCPTFDQDLIASLPRVLVEEAVERARMRQHQTKHFSQRVLPAWGP